MESEESKELVSISLEFMYRTVRGSQVELPCIIPGRTAPNVWYKDGVSLYSNNMLLDHLLMLKHLKFYMDV